jgi:hypothetical protein
MLKIIDFQITANGAVQPFSSFPALAGITQVAHIRVEGVRGSTANNGQILGGSGNVLHNILAPQTGQPLDSWVATPDLMEGSMIPLAAISFKGTSPDLWNVYVLVR